MIRITDIFIFQFFKSLVHQYEVCTIWMNDKDFMNDDPDPDLWDFHAFESLIVQ